jgi:hypothetical protein
MKAHFECLSSPWGRRDVAIMWHEQAYSLSSEGRRRASYSYTLLKRNLLRLILEIAV